MYLDFASGKVQLDSIGNLDDGIGVPDGPTVSGVNVGHSLLASSFLEEKDRFKRSTYNPLGNGTPAILITTSNISDY